MWAYFRLFLDESSERSGNERAILQLGFDLRRNPLKTLEFIAAQKAAILAVGIEIGKGNLPKLREKEVPCVDCGERATIYDHRDYNRPIEVVPVCKSCNSKRGSASFRLEPSFESSEPSAFEIFWQAYPRKVGKPAAKKAWGRVNVLSGDVLDGLEHWKRSVQWQDTQFIPHPATFLNQRRWEDKEVNNGTNGSKHADLQRRTLEAARRTMGADDHAGFDGVRVALPRGTDRS